MPNQLKMYVGEDFAHWWPLIDLPASGDPLDITCDVCRGKRHMISMELIQFGFIDDLHTFFMVCLDCGQTHAIRVALALDGEE